MSYKILKGYSYFYGTTIISLICGAIALVYSKTMLTRPEIFLFSGIYCAMLVLILEAEKNIIELFRRNEEHKKAMNGIVVSTIGVMVDTWEDTFPSQDQDKEPLSNEESSKRFYTLCSCMAILKHSVQSLKKLL